MATLGSLFVTLGKLFILGGSTAVGYIIITRVDPYKTELYSAVAPVFVMGIATFIIGDLFMSIYGMACDTILQCFLVDENLNKGKGGPKHCPNTLKEFVDNN